MRYKPYIKLRLCTKLKQTIKTNKIDKLDELDKLNKLNKKI